MAIGLTFVQNGGNKNNVAEAIRYRLRMRRIRAICDTCGEVIFTVPVKTFPALDAMEAVEQYGARCERGKVICAECIRRRTEG